MRLIISNCWPFAVIWSSNASCFSLRYIHCHTLKCRMLVFACVLCIRPLSEKVKLMDPSVRSPVTDLFRWSESFWGAVSRSVGQEIVCLLWNPMQERDTGLYPELVFVVYSEVLIPASWMNTEENNNTNQEQMTVLIGLKPRNFK